MPNTDLATPLISDRKFLHTMVRDERGNYPLAGYIWSGHEAESFDWLNLHPQPEHNGCRFVILQLQRRAGGEDWVWECSMGLTEKVFLHHSDRAETLGEAAMAALAFRPHHLEHQHNGAVSHWFSANGRGWVTAVTETDEARVFCDSGECHWWRRCASLGPVLEMCGGELRGKTADLHTAMTEAFGAPERFLRACAELVQAQHTEEHF